MKDFPLSKSDTVQRNTIWIYDEVTLFRMVTPKNTYRDLLKIVAKSVVKHAH